jgi:gas vesicle protein
MNGKSFFLGLLVGSITASITTLLTTPNSGEENRLNVKETANQFRQHLTEIKSNLHELQQAVSTATLEGKVSIGAFVSDLKNILVEWKEEIHPHQLQLQREISSIEKTIEEIEASLHK